MSTREVQVPISTSLISRRLNCVATIWSVQLGAFRIGAHFFIFKNFSEVKMKTLKTITYILATVFIGLIIGGVIFKNTAAWVSGIVLLAIDIVIGIALQYYLNRQVSNDNGFFAYYYKVNKISKDNSATAFFTTSEIVNSMVNLMDAKNCLSQEEYFFVSVVFETFNLSKNKLLLNQEGFVGLSNEIIAHFDLVAPYYKYCGDPNMQEPKDIEDYKNEYRQRAKILLKNKKIFQDEWMSLHKEFLQEFHSL